MLPLAFSPHLYTVHAILPPRRCWLITLVRVAKYGSISRDFTRKIERQDPGTQISRSMRRACADGVRSSFHAEKCDTQF